MQSLANTFIVSEKFTTLNFLPYMENHGFDHSTVDWRGYSTVGWWGQRVVGHSVLRWWGRSTVDWWGHTTVQ